MSKRTIPIADIIIDAGTRLRDLDPNNTERLREVLQEGHEFNDRMRVWTDGESYWLSHGFHRHDAYAAEGVEKVQVELMEGTLDDAIDDACRPHNAEHGRPETTKEKQARVKFYVERHMRDSARKIAEHVGVSKDTVLNHKHALQGVSGEESPPTPQEEGSPNVPVWPGTQEEETEGYVCPNCGGTEVDEDGDCANCHEPGDEPEKEEGSPPPPPASQKRKKPKPGAQKRDPRLWHEIEQHLGKALNRVDVLHKAYPNGPMKATLLRQIKQAMKTLEGWKDSVK